MNDTNPVNPFRQRALRLVLANQSLIHAYARVICRDSALSEDAAQEAMAAVLAKADNIPEPEAEIPWLKRLVRNKAIDQLTRHRRQQPLNERCLEQLGEALEQEHGHSAPLRRALSACLQTLTAFARTLLEARYRDGTDCAGLAASLGLAVSEVYVRIRRIKENLRRCITERLRLEDDHG
jgi:RNA polymerase sigma-70 factor (ECF subfamily)